MLFSLPGGWNFPRKMKYKWGTKEAHLPLRHQNRKSLFFPGITVDTINKECEERECRNKSEQTGINLTECDSVCSPINMCFSLPPRLETVQKQQNNKITHLEAHGEVLNFLVHVLLFLQSDCCFIQPGWKGEKRVKWGKMRSMYGSLTFISRNKYTASLYLFNLTRSLEAFPSSSTAWRRRSSFYREKNKNIHTVIEQRCSQQHRLNDSFSSWWKQNFTSNTPAAFWYRSTAFSRFIGSISLGMKRICCGFRKKSQPFVVPELTLQCNVFITLYQYVLWLTGKSWGVSLIWGQGVRWYLYFPARSRAMAAVSGVPFSMYIIQAFSMYWMASGIFFCSCRRANTKQCQDSAHWYAWCLNSRHAHLHHHTSLFNGPEEEEESMSKTSGFFMCAAGLLQGL